MSNFCTTNVTLNSLFCRSLIFINTFMHTKSLTIQPNTRIVLSSDSKPCYEATIYKLPVPGYLDYSDMMDGMSMLVQPRKS